MVLLLIVAAALFALQFLFNKQYKESQGDGLSSVILFALLTNLMNFFLMLALNGFSLQFTWFSLLIALAGTANGLLYTYFSFQALSRVNLSVYSIFAMLGGMLLPFLSGTLFYHEALTVPKLLCCILIMVSLALTAEKGKGGKKAIISYAAVFVFNGLSGVISQIHQSEPELNTSSENYMALKSLVAVLVCLVWLLAKEREFPSIKLKPFCFAGIYSVFSGLGNLFCLIALTKLDASIQYPLITGGTMVFSTLISFCAKEKPRLRTVLSMLIALGATVLIIL
ncbi:MAG: DMT family transporter [Clostridia bacterium]|nr:DMT family transporter [Clostridia bacterium]